MVDKSFRDKVCHPPDLTNSYDHILLLLNRTLPPAPLLTVVLQDKDWVLKTWILRVLEEDQADTKRAERRLAQSEDLMFMLQSGVMLCKLISK